MLLTDALAYTHKATVELDSGWRVTAYLNENAQTNLAVFNPISERVRWAVAVNPDDTERALLRAGVPPITADAWESCPYVTHIECPYEDDRRAVLDAVEAGRVPEFMARLTEDRSAAGLDRLRECASLVRGGAVAACMEVES